MKSELADRSIWEGSWPLYSDGNDYGHLEINGSEHPEHEECVMCGSTETTITEEADICHTCGFVYT